MRSADEYYRTIKWDVECTTGANFAKEYIYDATEEK
jgi:hypothetical protein